MNMKFAVLRNSKGFTLIELIVVIAILGVLAAVLITTIDPLDKINAANDAGVTSTLAQIGRAEDGYAANKNNFYAGGANVDALLTTLNTAGETKISSYAPPTGYAANLTFLDSPDACTSGSTCTGYAIIQQGLKSKKYVATPVYQVVNGKGCFVAVAITQAQLDALAGAVSGAGACP